MIKIETHLHVFGGSSCADGDNQLTVKKYLDAGYRGVVATTHFCRNSYVNYFNGKSHFETVDSFFKLYDDFSAVASKNGLKTFFGAEVRCLPTNTEYMLLGFDRQFLYDNIPLFCYSQEQLFNLAEENGLLMYQTHPFRDNVNVGNPQFMHGIESFNGHYHHKNNNDIAEEFCKKHNLIGLSGTDYHHDDQPITAGMYIPEDIDCERDLANYIFKNDFTNVEEHALYQSSYDKHLERKRNKNAN